MCALKYVFAFYCFAYKQSTQIGLGCNWRTTVWCTWHTAMFDKRLCSIVLRSQVFRRLRALKDLSALVAEKGKSTTTLSFAQTTEWSPSLQKTPFVEPAHKTMREKMNKIWYLGYVGIITSIRSVNVVTATPVCFTTTWTVLSSACSWWQSKFLA